MRFALLMLACVIVAYAGAAYITIPANPEVQFWNHVDDLRDKEIAEVRKSQPEQPILFFTGGSSCAFSIDPKIIEETCGLPAFNLGLPVSSGARYILHQALEKSRKADIIVVCLEPDILTYPDDFDASSFSFGLAVLDGAPSGAVGGRTFNQQLSPREYLNFSRPGPGFLTTWIAKLMADKGYRYQVQDIRYRGRIETQVKDPTLPLGGAKQVRSIIPGGKQLLQTFQNTATQRGVHLIYAMPWLLTDPDAAGQSRSANLDILSSIQPIIPTVDDGFQGVATDPSYFSDSGLHLSAPGSAIRSKALAEALRAMLNVGF